METIDISLLFWQVGARDKRCTIKPGSPLLGLQAFQSPFLKDITMKLLHLDSSILGQYSVSRELSAAIVAHETALHPGLEVTYHDLHIAPLLHLSGAHLAAFQGAPVTDPSLGTDISAGDGYINELFAHDVIVIGAPMYNFTVPTQLKALDRPRDGRRQNVPLRRCRAGGLGYGQARGHRVRPWRHVYARLSGGADGASRKLPDRVASLYGHDRRYRGCAPRDWQ